MKNLIIISLFLFGCNYHSFAQVHKHTLGVRATGLDPFRNMSIAYQLGLSKADRLDFSLNANGALSKNYSQLGGTGSIYYNHVWNIKGGFNWYLGIGVNYSAQHINPIDGPQTFNNTLSFGPQIGLEYDFNALNVPLLLSVDLRPSIIYNFNGGLNYNPANRAGISLRYTF